MKENNPLYTKETYDNIRFMASEYIKQGVYHTAIDLLVGLTELDEEIYDLQSLGALYLEIGDYDNALEYLDKALAKDPNHWSSVLNKINVLVYSDKKEEAITTSKETLKRCDDKYFKEEIQFVLSRLEEL